MLWLAFYFKITLIFFLPFICWLIVLGHEEGLRTRNHLSLLLLSYHFFIRPDISQTLLSLATAKKLMALFTYIISQLMEFEHWMISMELECKTKFGVWKNAFHWKMISLKTSHFCGIYSFYNISDCWRSMTFQNW